MSSTEGIHTPSMDDIDAVDVDATTGLYLLHMYASVLDTNVTDTFCQYYYSDDDSNNQKEVAPLFKNYFFPDDIIQKAGRPNAVLIREEEMDTDREGQVRVAVTHGGVGGPENKGKCYYFN